MGSPNPFLKLTTNNSFELVDFPRAADEAVLLPFITYTVDATGAVTTIDVTDDGGCDMLNVRITDNSNPEASYKFEPVTTGDTQNIDTSSLNADNEWCIYVYGQVDGGTDGKSADMRYVVLIKNPRNATGSTVVTP